MADISLVNSVSVNGTYDAEPLILTSNTVVTQIISGITVQKSADKDRWAEGELTYSITIANNADNSFETPKIVDVLNPDLIKLVPNSVKVNGTDAQYTYDESVGNLTVDIATIAVGASSVITFRVQQK